VTAPRDRLDAAQIVAAAEIRAGIADSDAGHLSGNLEALVAAMNAESRPQPWAVEANHDWLVNRTVHRLEGLRWLHDHPEIAAEAIAEPVFLTGLPRSGTTAFQYLFDRDPRFRLVRSWQTAEPSPPPGADPASVERRKAAESEARAHSLLPEGFEALHLMDLDGPDECGLFLEQAYAAAGFQNLLCVPSYFDHLVDRIDMTVAYRIHRRQLQLLQWQLPPKRWALKYPNHVLAMPQILAVYPDARFVMTHRDPVQTLASIARLTLMLRQMRQQAPVDPHEVGREMLHFVSRHIDRIMAFVRSPQGERVVHVDYYRMLDDPAGVMRRVHEGLGIDCPDEVRRAIAEWHAANPKGARGANPYALEQFGLDGEAVAERFADYRSHFAIPREQAGLARSQAAA